MVAWTLYIGRHWALKGACCFHWTLRGLAIACAILTRRMAKDGEAIGNADVSRFSSNANKYVSFGREQIKDIYLACIINCLILSRSSPRWLSPSMVPDYLGKTNRYIGDGLCYDKKLRVELFLVLILQDLIIKENTLLDDTAFQAVFRSTFILSSHL